ncbi:MAG: Snf7 family protein [Candidatus Heimdallarchaeaceae archaeon]
MGLKEWLFGKKRSDDAEALAVLKAQINRYEHEARNLERQADEQKLIAAKMIQSGNKPGAREALKRRAIYMKRLNIVHNMLMNLQAQVDSIQTAKSTVETVKAMEIGTKVVDTQLKTVSPEKAEAVMDKVVMQRDQLDMMTETLADTSLAEGVLDLDDDLAIDAQLAELEAEQQLGATSSLPDVSELPSTPTTARRERETELEEDTSDLEAELESLKKQMSEDENT